MSTRRPGTRPLLAAGIVSAFGVIMIVPFLWLLLISFSGRASFGLVLPKWTVANYTTVLSSGSGFGWAPFISSLYLGLVTAIVSTSVGFVAAFGLSRGRLRKKREILFGSLFLSALPLPALIVPIYEVYSRLSLLNSRVFTGLFIGITVLPFSVWILTNVLDGIPTELDEAAVIDGASTLKTLRMVILPVAAPGVSFAFIFGFLQGWGSFLVPLVLDTVPAHTPAPLALYDFMSTHTAFSFGAIGAFSVLFCIPVVVLYSVVSGQFGSGFSAAGALAG